MDMDTYVDVFAYSDLEMYLIQSSTVTNWGMFPDSFRK